MKKFLLVLLLILCSFLVVSCSEEENNEPSGDGYDMTNETVDGYTFEGTKTFSPYTVYDPDGNIYTPSANEEANPNVSMFHAIRLAATLGAKTRKSYSVKDARGTEIFHRRSNKEMWCYDGTYFVGVKSQAEAEEWSKTHKRCYIVTGSGSSYNKLGIVEYEGTNPAANYKGELEKISGGYNYMFSESGVAKGDSWEKYGFGYMEAYVRLSEATYRPSDDGSGWNAYIFINGGAGKSCDLGLIGGLRNNKVVWSLVRNCMHSDLHNSYDPTFNLPQGWIEVTSMTYDQENDCYGGADDLFFQVWQSVNGWTLKITNLGNGKEFKHEELHDQVFATSGDSTYIAYFRYLLAASYCPADDPVIWDGRCGAYLRNVVFDGVKIARYLPELDYSSSLGRYYDYLKDVNPYTTAMLEDFNPTSNMNRGYSQAADCSSAIFGTYDAAGTYKSGLTYDAGEYYISFSCYYDGGGHYSK